MRSIMVPPSFPNAAQEQRSVPLRQHAGTSTAHDRLEPSVHQRNESLRIDPARAIEKDLQFPARVERNAIKDRM